MVIYWGRTFAWRYRKSKAAIGREFIIVLWNAVTGKTPATVCVCVSVSRALCNSEDCIARQLVSGSLSTVPGCHGNVFWSSHALAATKDFRRKWEIIRYCQSVITCGAGRKGGWRRSDTRPTGTLMSLVNVLKKKNPAGFYRHWYQFPGFCSSGKGRGSDVAVSPQRTSLQLMYFENTTDPVGPWRHPQPSAWRRQLKSFLL